MAKELRSQPWVMTATGDYEGKRNTGKSYALVNPPVFNHSIYVRRIKVDTGDGGDVLINNAKASEDGVRRLKLDNTPANDTLEVAIGAWWDGIYIETLPTNASVEIYHGRDGES